MTIGELQSDIAEQFAPARCLQKKSASADARYSGLARFWGDWWIGGLMLPCAQRWPTAMWKAKSFFVDMAWRTSGYLRGSLVANARRILGDDAGAIAHRSMGKAVLGNFYDCLCEIAGQDRFNHQALNNPIGDINGRERYLEARAHKRGAILVTAHLGAFETAVTALRRDESRIHIVFRRDSMKRFERLRAAQRRRLGVIEAPVDEGLGVWIKLRDALLNNEVVLMQGDRVMPGQSGVRLPFFNGHMLFPSGPVKLAMMTGAPLVPIFAPRQTDGRVRIILEAPIRMNAQDGAHQAEHALRELAVIMERAVRTYPQQWLMLQRAFCEDLPNAP